MSSRLSPEIAARCDELDATLTHLLEVAPDYSYVGAEYQHRISDTLRVGYTLNSDEVYVPRPDDEDQPTMSHETSFFFMDPSGPCAEPLFTGICDLARHMVVGVAAVHPDALRMPDDSSQWSPDEQVAYTAALSLVATIHGRLTDPGQSEGAVSIDEHQGYRQYEAEVMGAPITAAMPAINQLLA
jgi:hypothetical protein